MGVSYLSVGASHSCALTVGGIAKCWGNNSVGQLGDGSTESSLLQAVSVQGLGSGAASVVAGSSYSCAVTSGALYCWGNGYGMVASRVSSVNDVVKQFSMNMSTKCYVTTTGAAKCWGSNASGQLGVGYQSSGDAELVPLQVVGLTSGVEQIAAGQQHVCASMSNGAVNCWGKNSAGQLGNGTTVDASVPSLVSGLSGPARTVTVGLNHTCAATGAGAAVCWGAGVSRQLGNGGTVASSVPVQVYGLESGVTAISSYGNHTCAIAGAGSVRCWGYGAFGQLGNGSTSSQSTPVAVKPLP